MAATHMSYAAEGWGVGEVWLEGDRLLQHELPWASGPARKYYRVTEQGSAHRERSLTDWQALVAGVDRITAPTTLGRTS